MTGLVSQSCILAKAEVTYNTDPVPVAATDAILVRNLKHGYTKPRMFERVVVKPTFAPLKPLYGGSLYEISFEVEIKGSGAAGTPPEVGVLLTAAGQAETIVASTSVTYKQTSTIANHKSATIYLYEAGHLYKVTGCRATKHSFAINAGEGGMDSFTFVGHLASKTDAALPSPTFDTTVPPIAIGLTSTIDSFAAIISKAEFDFNLDTATPDSILAADSYGEIQITNHKVTGSLNPHRSAISAYDWDSKWKTGGPYAFSSGTIGGTAGNRVAITATVQPTELGMSDVNKIATYDYKFAGIESTTDDEVTRVYT